MKHGRGGIYRALGNIALAVTLIASASLGPFRQTAHAQSPTPAPQTNPLYIPPPSPTPAPTSQSNPFFIPAPSLTPTATPQVITVVGISVAPGAITGTLALEGTVVVPSPTPATGLSLSLCQGIGTSADGISIGRPVFNPGGPPPPIVHGCGNGKDYVALFAPLERKAIDDLLQTYQLPASDAAELLRWERGLVRAAMFVRFVELVNKGQRTADEQALVSNVAAAAGRLRQEVATHALNEYNKWASNPCAYTPPTGFTYERDLQCTTATSALAGVYISGFRPPTSTEFLSYGLALATNDLGVLTAATMAEAAAGLGVLLGAAVGGAVVAGAVGAAIGAALPLAGLVSVLIPGSAAIAASAAAAAATAAGTATTAGAAATVAGSAGWVGAVAIGGPAAAIVLATAVAVIYTIHVADVSSDAVQAKLVAERDSANSAGVPDPAGLLSTTAGQAQLFAAFVKLTVPEVWEVNATVPAAQAGDGQFLVQASGAGSASYSPTLRYKSWDGSTHTARVSGRWFVVTDAAGRSSRSLDLQYQQPNGSTPTNWVASRVGNRLLHADTSATTASGTLDNRLRFVNPDGQPFEAQIVQNPQAPWIVGTASSSGVPSYLTLSPSATWNSTDGGATRVAVGPDGQPWLVNAQGVVYNRSLGTNGYANGAWQAASSPPATDISGGADGSVWLIDRTPGSGGQGFGVYRLMGTTGTWKKMPGAEGVAIAVGPDGQPWVVNRSGQIWRGVKGGADNSYVNGTFELVSGAAKDIGVGSDGSVWVIGTGQAGSSDYQIWKYGAGNQWQLISGGAVRIAVDGSGQPWVVNSQGTVFSYSESSSSWTQMGATGIASDIGAGAATR